MKETPSNDPNQCPGLIPSSSTTRFPREKGSWSVYSGSLTTVPCSTTNLFLKFCKKLIHNFSHLFNQMTDIMTPTTALLDSWM